MIKSVIALGLGLAFLTGCGDEKPMKTAEQASKVFNKADEKPIEQQCVGYSCYWTTEGYQCYEVAVPCSTLY